MKPIQQDPHIVELKRHLRHQCRMGLKEISPQERESCAKSALQILINSPLWEQSQSIMFFSSLPTEPNTAPLVKAAWAEKRTVTLPCIRGPHQIEPFQIQAFDQLHTGRFGILEPNPSICQKIDPRQINLIVIPGLGFDRHGMRLGRGAGYYDYFLKHKKHGTALGYFFSLQEVPTIPFEPHDQQLDYILTENELIQVQPTS